MSSSDDMQTGNRTTPPAGEFRIPVELTDAQVDAEFDSMTRPYREDLSEAASRLALGAVEGMGRHLEAVGIAAERRFEELPAAVRELKRVSDSIEIMRENTARHDRANASIVDLMRSFLEAPADSRKGQRRTRTLYIQEEARMSQEKLSPHSGEEVWRLYHEDGDWFWTKANPATPDQPYTIIHYQQNRLRPDQYQKTQSWPAHGHQANRHEAVEQPELETLVQLAQWYENMVAQRFHLKAQGRHRR
jgi:hypothetical protein